MPIVATLVLLCALLAPAAALAQAAPPAVPPADATVAQPAGQPAGQPTRGFSGVLQIGLTIAAIVGLVLAWREDLIRPGSFARLDARRDPRPLGTRPAAIVLAAAMLVVIGQAMAASLVHAALPAAWPDLARRAVTTLAAYSVAIGMAVWAIVALVPRDAPAPRPASLFTARDLRHGLVGSALMIPVAMVAGSAAVLLYSLATGRDHDPVAHATLRDLLDHARNPWMWAIVALAVVGAPIAEELLYRGLVQTGVLKLTGSTWAAVLATAALFVLIHLGGGVAASQWYALAPIAVVGIACGLAYERTRRLAVPILMHIAFNAFNVALALTR